MPKKRRGLGMYDHLDPVVFPGSLGLIKLDMDKLAETLVEANYGVHHLLSALVRARKKHDEDHDFDRDDVLMREIERPLDAGEC